MYLDEDDLKKALENENNESIINLTISEIKSEKNDVLQKLIWVITICYQFLDRSLKLSKVIF